MKYDGTIFTIAETADGKSETIKIGEDTVKVRECMILCCNNSAENIGV